MRESADTIEIVNVRPQEGRRPYSQYKETKLEWLSILPSHWKLGKLGYFASIKARLGWRGLKADEYVDDGYAFLSTPNIKGSQIDFINVNFIDEIRYFESPEIILHVGDVLLAKDGSTLGIVNIVNELPRPTTVNSSIAVIRPKTELDGSFLRYYLSGHYIQSVVQRMRDGMGVPHLFQDDIKQLWLAVPPNSEQRTIAAFLNRETARIDGLIAKKRRLIELLREKRQAVISHAVTKGLDPNAPMKASETEWLGEVPAHWELLRAKTLFREVDERSTSGDEELLTVSHISGVTRRTEKEVNMFLAETLEGYKKCHAGDLIINTMWAWMGALGFAQEDGIVSPSYNVYRVRQTQALSTKFFDLLVRTPQFVSEATSRSKGVWTSRLRLYPEAFFNIRMAAPPLPEQDAIIGHLDRVFGRYDDTIKAAELSIAKLEEHRAALIAAAVTGKIDVRAHSTDTVEAAD